LRIRLTVDGYWVRAAGTQPRFLAIEMLAQAAAVLHSGEDRRAPGYLAGVEDARWAGDFAAGDDIEARVAVDARLGALTRIRGALLRDGQEIFSCRLIVRSV
jgi:hypothetical protein